MMLDVLEESQHVEVVFAPGSQSSPSSTIPSISPSVLCYITIGADYSLPHCCRLITVLCPGVCIQLVDTALFRILLHIFPNEHAENVCSVVDVVGFMMN